MRRLNGIANVVTGEKILFSEELLETAFNRLMGGQTYEQKKKFR